MHRVSLTYQLERRGATDAAAAGPLSHPLFEMLGAIHAAGSIAAAARRVGRSYRHVWGEIKRWEDAFDRPLVRWVKGSPATLSPFGEKLLWAERRARARLAPQLESLHAELERAFAIAFDDEAQVLTIYASHDHALPALRELAARQERLHLDVQFTGSVDALAALNAGRCEVAGCHALVGAAADSPTGRAFRPLLEPGRHKLLACAWRTQGLLVPAGNPRRLTGLADLAAAGMRFAHRQPGAGSRVLLDELLARAGVDAAGIDGRSEAGEPSHEAVAAAVASGAADAGFGIESAARRHGLDFVALAEERYMLVCLKSALEQAPLRALRDLLAGAAWREALARVPGYVAGDAGAVLSLTRVFPWWPRRGVRRRAPGR